MDGIVPTTHAIWDPKWAQTITTLVVAFHLFDAHIVPHWHMLAI
jgi:hypothetical protein